jgi:hypothetical protein
MKDKGYSGSSQNACVNDRGKIHGGKGGPKSTTDGRDLGPHATNSLGKFTNKMLSPNAQAAAQAPSK